MCETLECLKEQLTDIENECTSPDTEIKIAYEPAKPELESLPVEIFLRICSFLEADFLLQTVAKVCTRFESILADDHMWKCWLCSKLDGGCFPPLPNLKIYDEIDIDWVDWSLEVARGKKQWDNVEETMRHVVVRDVHYASVDTVLLFNGGEYCVSGGRDRGMALWNVFDIKPNQNGHNQATQGDIKPHHIRPDAHSGWVWDLTPDRIDNASVVYSASWDNTVKAWDIRTGFTCIETFQCRISALAVVTCDNLIMAGLYSKKILSFDPRTGPAPVHSYQPHRGPVLGLESYNNKVASVSEDRTLAIWDRVAGKTLVTDVKMPTEKAFPVCISWSDAALYIGDSRGALHLIHPQEHRYLKSHRIWTEPPLCDPSSKITSCLQTKGTLILCSDRGEIRFMYNGFPPQKYSTVNSTTFDVTQMRYLDGVICLGTCDSALEFWVPVEKCFNMNIVTDGSKRKSTLKEVKKI